MAFDDTQLPAQATGATLPGQAADLADIAPAPSAENALLAANFGDKGAQAYRDLRAAGQQAPTPTATPATPLATLAGGPAATPAAIPAAPTGISSLLGATLQGYATGDPSAGRKMFDTAVKQQQAQQLATRQAQQQLQAQAIADGTFLEQLKDKPLNLRAAMIQSYAARQGRELSPAEATYIADIKPDVIAHTIERAKMADPMALSQLQTIFGGDPLKMVGAHDQMRKSSADADRAIDEAAITHGNVPTPESIAADATKKAVDVAAKLRTLQQPPSPADIQVLDAAGLEAYQVPIAGAAGGTMWSTRPKAGAGAGTVSAGSLREAQAKEAGAKKQEQTAASPIPATTVEKLSGYDSALDIIGQLRKLYEKGSPTDVERQNWFNRLKQEAQYRWGFDMPDNLDEDTALRSLGAITAGRAFIQGRPNQQLMNEIWKHTGQNPLVSPNQMRDRLNIMERQVRTQKERMIAYAQSGRGDLTEAGIMGEGTSTAPTTTAPSGEINAEDFLKQ